MTKPIQKILIANRGEIARRITRTCRLMNIESIVLLLPEELKSPLAQEASTIIEIDPYADKGIFLNAAALIEIAKSQKACAIHPGFGFLSENADFAKDVRDAGLIFIGPQSQTILKMGLKNEAKEIAKKAKVPLIPGFSEQASEKNLLKKAKEIGFPILIKACAGGGGKGLLICESESDFPEKLKQAQSEALKAFNDNSIMLEKLVTQARHIEVQIFGDSQGQVVHLYERDCSLQRRHQKIIEEAPAHLPNDIKTKLYEAATQLAKAVSYENAGTVEFLVDSKNEIYFLEMNTRLQVEHPVTEQITGLDLVEWQIRIAQGEPLPLTQSQIQSKGHSVEARVYAETPHHNFFPSLGTLHQLKLPHQIRLEHNLYKGLLLTPDFDPMLAKVISTAPTREQALKTLQKALTNFQTLGLQTNISFLKELLSLKDFTNQKQTIDLVKTYHSTIDWSQRLQASLQSLGYSGQNLYANEKLVEVEQGHSTAKADYARFLSQTLYARGPYGELAIKQNPGTKTSQSLAHSDSIVAPLPGVVIEILVTANQSVKAGQTLLVLEAMKMQHSLKATQDVIVQSVTCQQGQLVKEDQILVEFQKKKK